MQDFEDHHSVRIVLLNQDSELLLMRAVDPTTTRLDGTHDGPFWFLVGGEIKDGESQESAAFRELEEETGLSPLDVQLGPELWYGDFPLILYGKKRWMKQSFILARTEKSKVTLRGLTKQEKKVVHGLDWFSLEKMRASEEVIYPVGLEEHLEPVLRGDIPKIPLKIDLNRRPAREPE